MVWLGYLPLPFSIYTSPLSYNHLHLYLYLISIPTSTPLPLYPYSISHHLPPHYYPYLYLPIPTSLYPYTSLPRRLEPHTMRFVFSSGDMYTLMFVASAILLARACMQTWGEFAREPHFAGERNDRVALDRVELQGGVWAEMEVEVVRIHASGRP
jgi:hypothetical protein